MVLMRIKLRILLVSYCAQTSFSVKTNKSGMCEVSLPKVFLKNPGC